MKNTLKLVVGDWSHDGHNQSEFVYFDCNLTEVELKAAYLEAVEKCGVGLHRPRKGEKHTAVCTEYEQRTIPLELKAKMEAVGVDFEKVGGSEIIVGEWGDFGGKGIAKLFLELVKAARPHFEYEIINDRVPCVNGFWSKDFNISFGYGMYA
jgi:hypothetical protein